ncbi:MAG: T9SS type A sorting domain-containing protein [Bacteroidetes bacterium]|nr:T9SS type A sorting domain-containing protein [Bacteroidota bacterium]
MLILWSKSACSQNYAVNFNGIDDYISFGNDSNLNLEQFTVECWFKRSGAGVATNTGTDGAIAVPLVTKGTSESDNNTRDLNYFLGIDSITNVLTTDIEEGNFQHTPGLNHPVYGNTPILWNVWYHAAMTFNGNQMSIYLNGQLEIAVGLGVKVQSQSIQHTGIGTALTSYGAAEGFFKGKIDEVRIWNYARTIREIQNSINTSISTPQAGLVANWDLDEGAGTFIYDSSGNTITGLFYGTGPAWGSGAPMNLSINYVPDYPATISPQNNDTCVAVNNAELKIHAFDSGSDPISVKFFGRPAFNSPPPFTIVPLPDTQFYVSELWGGTNEVLKSQTNWIVANQSGRNIKYVTQMGDCVQNGDNGGDDTEWRRADTAFAILEDPFTTGLMQGIPFSVSVGNHDQIPKGTATGTTIFYNQFFGTSRFGGRSYYGGHYGLNNDNHFSLFSASGMDFVEVSLEYDGAANPNPAVLNWADSIIQAYPNRRAIVTSHYILNVDGSFGIQGQAIYDQLKDNPNLFLMLCAHMHDEFVRKDVYNGNTVYTILSDYQTRSYGGYGWLKILEFRPEINKILVKTYSPFLDLYETDSNSEYTIDHAMTPAFQLLDSVVITSGSEASFIWSGLQMNAAYEWYAVMSDGKYEQITELNKFSTNNNEQIYIGTDVIQCGGQVSFGTNDTNYTYLWSTGSTNPFITVNQTGNYTITATSIAGNCAIKDTVSITINEIPQTFLGADTSACAQLVLGASTDTNFVYTWQDGSNDSILTAYTSGTYSLYIQNSSTGCFSSDTISLIIYPLPVVNLGSDTVQCGGSIAIGIADPGNTYSWSTGSLDSILTIATSGQYVVTATSIANGCMNSDTMEVTINAIPQSYLGLDTAACVQLVLGASTDANFIYTWQDGSTDSIFTAYTSGDYSLLIQNSSTGCFSSDTINITIYSLPVVNLGSDTTQCDGNVTIGSTAIGSTFLWSTGSIDSSITTNISGTYILTATSSIGGCINSDTVNVTIHPVPLLNLGVDTAACAQLTLYGTSGSNYNYYWNDGSNLQDITITSSGIYSLSIENGSTGCTNADTIQIVIYPLPVFDLGNDTTCTICELNLTVPDFFQSYLWNTGATNNSIHIYTPGKYILEVVDGNGCSSRDSILIGTSTVIYPNPVTDQLIVYLPVQNSTPQFYLYDELGRSLTVEVVNNYNNFVINTREFSKGIYFLTIANEGEQQRFKIIKQ